MRISKQTKKTTLAQQGRYLLICLLSMLLLFLAGSVLILNRTQRQVYEQLEEISKLYTDELDNRFFRISRNLFSTVMDSSNPDSALKAENPDIVGWIRMDPTCDYPIMQAQDNDYYLYKGFGRSYNINGSIFLSSVNSSDFSDKNSIVYGHNMRNGDMFGDNDYYHEKSYCLEHPYFWIYRENGQYTYRIFDVMRVTDATEAYDTQFASDDDFETY